jgi:hypothetical protein
MCQHGQIQSCLAQKAPRVFQAACHTPTFAKITKISHIWPAVCPRGQSCLKWDRKAPQSTSSFLPHTNMCQHGQNQSCLAQKAPRVPSAVCHTSTCSNMTKINYFWPAACPSRSVMPEVGLESTQSASSCLPHTNMCQIAKINHVWLRTAA